MPLPHKFFRHSLVVGLLLCLCLTARAAVGLRDYAARLKNAQFSLEGLRQREEDLTDAEHERVWRDVLNYVRSQLPETDTVDGPDGSFQVDNKWLHVELDEYQKLVPASQEADRKLESIAARLAALRNRIEDLSKTQSANNTPGKDEQKGTLERILRRPEYNKQQEKSAVARLVERLRNFLRSLLPKSAVPDSEQTQRASPFAQVIAYGLVALALGLAVWRIAPFLRRSGLKRTRRKEKKEARVVLGEKLAPDQTAADLFTEAEKLARQGDLRAAIRKGYIALLCELGDRKVIRLEQHKTNRDYLRDIAGQEALARPFGQLTNRFEYHWYGLAPARETDWDDFRQRYRTALEVH